MVKAQVNQSKTLSPFEDSLDLTTLVRLKKSGYVIGAYLLSKNQVGDTNNTLQLIFGYTCTGIHPSFNSSKQVEAIAEAFENGCKEIPQGERVTFRWSSFCSDSDIEERYQYRLTTPVSDESEFLDYAQLARTQELIRNKQRKTITLNIYTTFTVKPGGTEPGDPIDRAITKLSNFLQRKFTPTGASELTNKVLTQILEKAINASLRYQQILSSMKLHPSPKSEKQLWKELSNHIGSIPTKVPHTLILDEQGLREEFNESSVSPRRYVEQTHAASVLLNNGVPYADRKWVCLPTRDGSKKYVGVMTLAQKPEIFQSVADQICFLWNVFSRDVIHDIEVITEISPADPKMVRVAQQLITKRSHNTARSNSKTIDVLSQINVERSVDAQKQLYTPEFDARK
jgi:hypothetical protein